ncbi:MAG TPA: DUF6234 family protein [Streptomyces sp.]|nr:DUF6234 family protein [Streptomyces sp.]
MKDLEAPERRPVSGWGDAALAVFVLATDVLACLTASIWLWGAGGGEVAALAVFGGLAAALALTAYAFGKGGQRITAWAQLLAALLLGLMVAHGAVSTYAATHPEPTPTGPGQTGSQCRSGGDSSECLGG